MLVLGIINDFTLRNLLTNVVLLVLPICLFFYKIVAENNGTIQEMDRLREINENLIGSTISNV